jgi:hypothetical protein
LILYSDLIENSQAILDGTAENYHDVNGFGSPPPLKKAKKAESESAETPAEETTAASSTPTAEPEASATPTCESHVCKNDAEL